MGNCWGSREEKRVVFTARSASGVKNFQGPVPARALTRIVAQEDEVVAKTSEGGVTPRPALKEFTYSELRSITKNFRADFMVGEGGFGRVYKGWVDENTLGPSKIGVGLPVAVKRCSHDSTQGYKEWKAEIDLLGKLSHPNLVKLIGYCWDDKELLLVYEFILKGSLENHLFQRNVDAPSWSRRISIAKDAARGLNFLHTSQGTVIYRDFKAANILLNENYEAKLSDFGLARAGPTIDKSHITTDAVGTYGYAAPEYINSGHLYIKSDVYGFGVVLLEMLTGKRAYDKNRACGQTGLADWFKPMLDKKSKIKALIDPRMGEYPSEGVNKLCQLILACLQDDPRKRPPMNDVLKLLEKISIIELGSKKSRPNSLKLEAHSLEKKPNKAHSYHHPTTLHKNTLPQPRRYISG